MYSEDDYLGCPTSSVGRLRTINDKLSTQAVEHVNDSQELVMLNNFARESSEYQFRRCLQDRVSDIVSWQWVLEDLTKRLDEAAAALQYEHNALRVVVERVQNELDTHSREASRPGALCPMSDAVEEAIIQECNFLSEHKRKFEKMITDLENEMKALNKTKKRIQADILQKQQTISLEQACARIDVNSSKRDVPKKKKKRGFSVSRWENRCIALKKSGLRVLCNAAVTRQQVRGARVHLSIAAQAYAARVDSALRKRLHTNKIKLQDLKWHRDEALRDYNALEEELLSTEQNLLETMEQERVIEARLIDRSLRPFGELTRDDVDRKLRDELGRLRNFSKQLRVNLERITSLQNHLVEYITRIDSFAEDLLQVIMLDEERIKMRAGNLPECPCNGTAPSPPANPSGSPPPPPGNTSDKALSSIREEDEDDYPLDN